MRERKCEGNVVSFCPATRPVFHFAQKLNSQTRLIPRPRKVQERELATKMGLGLERESSSARAHTCLLGISCTQTVRCHLGTLPGCSGRSPTSRWPQPWGRRYPWGMPCLSRCVSSLFQFLFVWRSRLNFGILQLQSKNVQADSVLAPSPSLKNPEGHLTHDASEVEGSAVE